MINNIIKQLTIIFLNDYKQQINIINKKLDLKSTYTWMIIIVSFVLIYLSFEGIYLLKERSMEILFLKVYLPLFSILMIIQVIALSSQVFYYSKDLEFVLPLPIKPRDILIAKYNTLVIIIYFFEAIFLLVPLLSYGILTVNSIDFMIKAIITLIVLPMFLVSVINIIMLFVMKLTKFYKNKTVFQLLTTMILIFGVIFVMYLQIRNIIEQNQQEQIEIIKKINLYLDEINDRFVIINPIIKMLINNENSLINIIRVIFINIIPLIIFILIGERLYLDNILCGNSFIKNKKKNKKINKKFYKRNKSLSYLKKDLNCLIKNPIFFIQHICQYISIVVIVILLIIVILPLVIKEMQQENFWQDINIEQTKLEITLIVVAGIQILFTFANLSISAISREGSNAVFLKYIPISLYKQFKIKTVPQTMFNTFVICAIIVTFYKILPKINIIYYIILFILSMILNILNSYLMLLIDLNKPNIKWTNEESIAKNSTNKIYQYASTIIIIVLLKLFYEIFNKAKFIWAIIGINLIYLILLIILKIYIKKNINKLFEKIC